VDMLRPQVIKKIGAICILLIGLNAPLTNTFALSLETPPEFLTQKADLIIVGRLIGKHTEDIEYIGEYIYGKDVKIEKSRHIISMFDVELIRTFKHQFNNPRITLHNPGGVLPSGRASFGAVTFDLEKAECIVAFLWYDKLNKWWSVVGGSKGVFRFGKCSDDDLMSNAFDPLVTRVYKGNFVPNNSLPESYRKSDTGLTLRELLNIIERESKK